MFNIINGIREYIIKWKTIIKLFYIVTNSK